MSNKDSKTDSPHAFGQKLSQPKVILGLVEKMTDAVPLVMIPKVLLDTSSKSDPILKKDKAIYDNNRRLLRNNSRLKDDDLFTFKAQIDSLTEESKDN